VQLILIVSMTGVEWSGSKSSVVAKGYGILEVLTAFSRACCALCCTVSMAEIRLTNTAGKDGGRGLSALTLPQHYHQQQPLLLPPAADADVLLDDIPDLFDGSG
jgi:hypothetical protein